ncbi:MAG: 3-oxoacyl-[acyl-carrier protein] reductase, partial [uncultured Thermomicrobiales bacterium]
GGWRGRSKGRGRDRRHAGDWAGGGAAVGRGRLRSGGDVSRRRGGGGGGADRARGRGPTGGGGRGRRRHRRRRGGDGRGGDAAARSPRRAGQQCRHHPRRTPDADERGGLGRRPRHEPEGRVPLREGGGAADAAAALRTDRESDERDRTRRQRRPGELRGGQGGADRLHQVARQGGRFPRDHGQCRRPRLHRNPPHPGPAAGSEGLAPEADAARPLRRAGGRRRRGRFPGLPRSGVRHRPRVDGRRRPVHGV